MEAGDVNGVLSSKSSWNFVIGFEFQHFGIVSGWLSILKGFGFENLEFRKLLELGYWLQVPKSGVGYQFHDRLVVELLGLEY